MDLRRDHLQQRRLAGSVRTNDYPAVGLIYLPVDVVDQGRTVPDNADASQVHNSSHGFNLQFSLRACFFSCSPRRNHATYVGAMESLPSVRMTANLNSMISGQQSIEQAER